MCCWKKVFVITSTFSWQNSFSLCPASFCSSRPNLPVSPCISWLLTFALIIPEGTYVLQFSVGILSPKDHQQEPACQCRRGKRCRFGCWVGKIPWRRKWQLSLIFLPGKFHGERSLMGYCPRDHRELDMAECACTHTQRPPLVALIIAWTPVILYQEKASVSYWYHHWLENIDIISEYLHNSVWVFRIIFQAKSHAIPAQKWPA